MTSKRPRSWAEARQHPAIHSIEDTRINRDDNEDMPWLVQLMDGWSLNQDLTSFYVSSLADLRGLWGDIERQPTREGVLDA